MWPLTNLQSCLWWPIDSARLSPQTNCCSLAVAIRCPWLDSSPSPFSFYAAPKLQMITHNNGREYRRCVNQWSLFLSAELERIEWYSYIFKCTRERKEKREIKKKVQLKGTNLTFLSFGKHNVRAISPEKLT